MTDTTTPPRTPGARGLLPINRELHDQLPSATALGFNWPAVTYPIDKTGGLTQWGMMGNGPDPTLTANGGQPMGDCGVAAVPGHANMAAAIATGQALAPNTMSSNAIASLYFTYQAELAGITWRPSGDDWTAPSGLDNGVDLGSWLLWLFQQGIIEGFVKLDPAHMDAALQLGLVVVVGVDLTPSADQEFSDGQPWSVGPGNQPDPSEGHAILRLKSASPSGPDGYITWGADQPATGAWTQACVQQAFGVVPDPDAAAAAEAAGFPYQAVLDALRALGGTVVPDGPQPAPAPTPAPPAPTPAPTPTPTPTTPPEALVREVVAEVETLAKGAIAGIVTLVHRLGGSIPEWSGTEEAGPPA